MNWLANIGIEVHQIYVIHLRILFSQISHCCYHAIDSITEALSSTGNQNKFLPDIDSGYVMSDILLDIYFILNAIILQKTLLSSALRYVCTQVFVHSFR